MANKRYSSFPKGAVKPKEPGTVPSGKEKDSGFPGVPGKTQGKNRSGGVPTSGPWGQFYVKKEGL